MSAACPDCGQETLEAELRVWTSLLVEALIPAWDGAYAVVVSGAEFESSEIEVDELGCTNCDWTGKGVEVELH